VGGRCKGPGYQVPQNLVAGSHSVFGRQKLFHVFGLSQLQNGELLTVFKSDKSYFVSTPEFPWTNKGRVVPDFTKFPVRPERQLDPDFGRIRF